MYKIEDVVYESGCYWVLKVAHGYDVYKVGTTHSTRCAQIGYAGQIGIEKAIAEIARRETIDNADIPSKTYFN